MATKILLTIGKGRKAIAINVFSLAEASQAYTAERDASGEGQRKFSGGSLFSNGKRIGRVSYNGKVWGLGEWQEGDVPLFEAAKWTA